MGLYRYQNQWMFMKIVWNSPCVFFPDKYRAAGKRFINEVEIGMAALETSIEKCCNPHWNPNLDSSQPVVSTIMD